MPADSPKPPDVKQGTSSRLESASPTNDPSAVSSTRNSGRPHPTRTSKEPSGRWAKRLASPVSLIFAVIIGLATGIPGATYLKSKLDLDARDHITAIEKRRADIENEISHQRVISERALSLINDAITRTTALIALMSEPISVNVKELQHTEAEKNKAIADYKIARDNLLLQRNDVGLRFQTTFRKTCLLREEWEGASADALNYIYCFESSAKDRDSGTKCSSDMTTAIHSASALGERIAEAMETEESHAEEEKPTDRTPSPCRNYPPISTPSPR